MDDTADTQYLVLPVDPAEIGELSIEELEKVGGGDLGEGKTRTRETI